MSPDVNPNILLGRIRFLNKCIECFRKSEHLPESLCYVPKEVCYKICKDSSSGSVSASSSTAGNSGGKSVVSVRESPYQAPHKKSCKCNIEPKKSTCIRTTGEEYCNGHGLWVKISKVELLYVLLDVAWNWCQIQTLFLLICCIIIDIRIHGASWFMTSLHVICWCGSRNLPLFSSMDIQMKVSLFCLSLIV